MRTTFLFLLSAIASVALVVTACQDKAAGAPAITTEKDSAWFVKRGEYLVSSVGCDDCHSPKRMGAQGPELIPELRLSGYPHDQQLPPADSNAVKNGWSLFGPGLTSAVGGWGISFAANITSDETGIGNWSLEQFLTAIRKGKYKGNPEGRDLLPPMPWFAYKNMDDEDLKAIFTYLKTVQPVSNVVPAPRPLSALK